MNEIESYFHKLRFDKNHHLGLGDIRLTIAQQDELVALFEQKLNIHSVMQAEGSEETRRKFCLWYYAQSQPLDANKVVSCGWGGSCQRRAGHGEARIRRSKGRARLRPKGNRD